MKDPYEAMGVSRSATEGEIKTAYRKLAKALHPDLNPGNKQSEQKFKEVASAYEILSDPAKRGKYDRGELDEQLQDEARSQARGQQSDGEQRFRSSRAGRRSYSQTQGASGAGAYRHSFSPEDFADLFGEGGFGGQGNFSFAGQDVTYRMEIDLKTAVHGAERDITLPGGKNLRVKIPAGVTDGTRLRFAGQGGPGVNAGPTGDAYVELKIKASPFFERDGIQLEFELPISLNEAIQGTELRVPTVDGPVMLKVPSGVSSGSKLRIRGKGLPTRENPKERGDQLVRIKIIMPPHLDDELKRVIADWSVSHPQDVRGADFIQKAEEAFRVS